jgi:hypothetical protein
LRGKTFYFPHNFSVFALLLIVLFLVVGLVLVGLIGVAFAEVGFSPVVTALILVGTFAGIFEAWLIYSESLFFFGLFLYASRRSTSTLASVGPGLVSIIMLFTHPWTWLVLILILAGQIVVLVIQSRSSDLPLRRSMSPQLRVLALSLLIGGIAFSVGSTVCPAMGTARDTTMST